MRSFVSKYKYYLLLSVIFFISELLVNPVANVPLNDDWTYGKSVLILESEGRVDIGNFAAMSLLAHILWGFTFVKVFGFSFTVLRLSTLVSSLIGIFVLHRVVTSVSKNARLGFISALALLFNPLYFNLSNTFMTDVNFNTLLILCCYFAYDFFTRRNRISFVLVFCMSTLLVLIRQFGILVPLCFVFACLFVSEKRWLWTGMSLAGLLLVYAVFKYYEHYLKGILPEWASYKFSGAVDPGSAGFWENLSYNFGRRYKPILMHLLIYTFPVALIFLKGISKRFKNVELAVVAVAAFALVWFLFRDEVFPSRNVFMNMSLGVESFYESLSPADFGHNLHTYAPDFANIMQVVKYVFSGATLSILALLVIHSLKTNSFRTQFRSEQIFFLSFFAAYIFLILITESYFDRYHLPLITLLLLFIAALSGNFTLSWRPASIVLVLMFYISVFGTKDYLELNRVRWQAYGDLKKQNVASDKINGGFEVNCWNDGQITWWSDFLTLDNFDYLIQYKAEDGFSHYRSYPFQRYFPYEKDSISVFRRNTALPK